MLCQGGEAVELTEDHRPNGDSPMSKEEIARIKSAGGWVSADFEAPTPSLQVDVGSHRERLLSSRRKLELVQFNHVVPSRNDSRCFDISDRKIVAADHFLFYFFNLNIQCNQSFHEIQRYSSISLLP